MEAREQNSADAGQGKKVPMEKGDVPLVHLFFENQIRVGLPKIGERVGRPLFPHVAGFSAQIRYSITIITL